MDAQLQLLSVLLVREYRAARVLLQLFVLLSDLSIVLLSLLLLVLLAC